MLKAFLSSDCEEDGAEHKIGGERGKGVTQTAAALSPPVSSSASNLSACLLLPSPGHSVPTSIFGAKTFCWGLPGVNDHHELHVCRVKI